MEPLKESAQRVQNILGDMGYSNQVVELPEARVPRRKLLPPSDARWHRLRSRLFFVL